MPPSPRPLIAAGLALGLALPLAPRTARAEDIVIVTPGERSRSNKLLLGALVGGAVALGGAGLYFHLDGKAAADDVSAKVFTAETWTPDDQALVDAADRGRTRAIVAYGLGGALLVTAVVALIVTEPPSETTVIRPRGAPTVAPTAGGAVLGGVWSF